MNTTSTLDPQTIELLESLSEHIDVAALAQTLSRLPAGQVSALLRSISKPPRTPVVPPVNGDFYDLDASLTPEQRRIRDGVRAFMETEIRPVINDYWLKGEYPMHLVPKIGAMVQDTFGAEPFQFPYPDPVLAGVVFMEICRVDPSTCTFIGVPWGLTLPSIYLFGSEEQKERWIGPLQRFEALGSWALTEPEVGSATAAGLKTVARRNGTDWVLDGQKKWSGNALVADINVIWAKNTETGQVNGFLVERDTPGYHVEKLEGKIAQRAVYNVLITLDGCRIPDSARLPGANSFKEMAVQLAPARAGVAWEAAGLAQGVYELTLDYCNRREQFGKPIAGFQLVQEKLARMLGHVTAMQTLVMQLARLEEAEGHISHERASLAKMWCCETMRETVAIGRGLLGGNGILLEHHVARLFADAEALYSFEGTHEMNALIVGRAITGRSAFV